MRVLYVQYTNPGAYPPLARGAHLLADAGCTVRMLGVQVHGTEPLAVPVHSHVSVETLPPAGAGWRLKAHYGRYATWVVREAARWRPDWIYASDPLAAPVALAAARVTRSRIVYHEHDAPGDAHDSWFTRRCLSARRELVARADVRVVPNAERAAALSRLAGGRSVHTVWNCPALAAIRPVRPRSSETLRVIYRGSINDQRLPRSVIRALAALPEHVTLFVAGYETVGSRGYVAELSALARRTGVGHRVRTLGAVPNEELDEMCERAHLGLALMPMDSADVNMRQMTGASNKFFEYLAAGAVPLVSDLPDWRSTFVDPGYAVACDPTSEDSIARALACVDLERAHLREIADRGRGRLWNDWNYEAQFAPVLGAMMGSGARTAGTVEAACAS